MKEIKDAQIIVVKVGTSTLTYPSGMLNLRRIDVLVKTLCDLQNSGKKMILVSSGAVSAGLAKIGFVRRPETIEEKQAAGDNRRQLDEQYSSLEHLTREIVEILIDYISVGRRIPGTRDVPIEIHWAF